jgi:6-phosphogluconolactonase
MTSSQNLVYVGSYAAAHEPGIRAFRFDAASGNLRADWSFAGITNPSFLTVHPNGRWLYAVSETSQHKDGKHGEVWSLRLPNNAASDPQVLNHQASGGDWPCHLVIDGTGCRTMGPAR